MADPAHAIIVADGEVDRALLRTLAAGRLAPSPRDTAAGSGMSPSLVVAADGGAEHCLALGLEPDVLVGDLDSITPEALGRLRERGIELRQAPRDKDESDMELCLLLARERGMARVTVLGGLGLLRPEHSIANLLLLADPRFDAMAVVLAGHGARTWRIGTSSGPGEAQLSGRPGDYVSLFALDPSVAAVRTEGLRFPLDGEDLPLGPSRGLSNRMVAEDARIVSGRGRLVIVHTDQDAESRLTRWLGEE